MSYCVGVAVLSKLVLLRQVTEHTKEKSHGRGHKLTFHPFLLLEAKGVGIEILIQGVTFFNVQCGVGHISVASQGPCICGQAADSSPQVYTQCSPPHL